MLARSFIFGSIIALLTMGAVNAKAESAKKVEEGFCKTPSAENQKFQISGKLLQWDPDISGLFAVADESEPVVKYWMLVSTSYEQEQDFARTAGSQVTLLVKCVDFNNFDYVSVLNP